jgi:hypothetical protein
VRRLPSIPRSAALARLASLTWRLLYRKSNFADVALQMLLADVMIHAEDAGCRSLLPAKRTRLDQCE